MADSKRIAALLGPTLIATSASEAMNPDMAETTAARPCPLNAPADTMTPCSLRPDRGTRQPP